VIYGLSYLVMVAMGRSLPDPHVAWLMAPVLFVVFFLGAVAEEVGWTGYATEALLRRWNGLQTSLIVGVFWSLIHVVPLIQAGRGAWWIVWQCVTIVLIRPAIVWLYLGSGRSLAVAVIFHAMSNVSYALFPNEGSAYDPVILAVIMGVLTVLLAQRLMRHRS
jgi:membrane protease YdiL (CAAX protease family)